MSYTPINMQMFIASYSGAIAGMGASNRRITNPSAASYADLAAIAGAFAQSFDTVWNDATAANVLELDMAEQLAESAWQQRSPVLTANAQNLTVGTYTELTTALVAVIQAASTYMAAQGITPPGAGGVDGVLNYDVVGVADGSPDNNRLVQISGTDPAGLVNVTASRFLNQNQQALVQSWVSYEMVENNGGNSPYEVAFLGQNTQGPFDGGPMYLGAGRSSVQVDGSLFLGAGDITGALPAYAWRNYLSMVPIDGSSQTYTIPGADSVISFSDGTMRVSAASNSFSSAFVTTTSATAGAGDPTPATVEQFLSVVVNGISYKIPLYAP